MPSKIVILTIIGLVASIGIFLIDLNTPRGVALGVVYLGMIFVGLIIKHRAVVIAFAAIATALVFAGYLFSPRSIEVTTSLINLGLTLFVIWLAAFILIFHLIQEQKYTAKLAELANHDALTSLHNRHYFNQQLNREIAKSRRYRTQLSLLMIDIDHFKKINDSYGHPVGDQVLKSLADICRAVLRDVDISVRFGGEEFVVILPSTNISGALLTAERIRAGVEEFDFIFEDIQLKATVSIGVTSYDNNDWTDKDLIKAVDIALYEAKKNGRNQVCEFDGEKTQFRMAMIEEA